VATAELRQPLPQSYQPVQAAHRQDQQTETLVHLPQITRQQVDRCVVAAQHDQGVLGGRLRQDHLVEDVSACSGAVVFFNVTAHHAHFGDLHQPGFFELFHVVSDPGRMLAERLTQLRYSDGRVHQQLQNMQPSRVGK
jgi:hypothetical protein